MRWLASLIALTALSACTGGTVPSAFVPYRNPTAPVASQADVTLARLSGTWRVVEAAGRAVAVSVVINAEEMQYGAERMRFVPLDRGRFLLGETEVWVHWLDVDNRTAAIGEPGGDFVWIMDKSGKPGERLKAAREILAWYGYDLRRMGERQDG